MTEPLPSKQEPQGEGQDQEGSSSTHFITASAESAARTSPAHPQPKQLIVWQQTQLRKGRLCSRTARLGRVI